MIKGYLTKRYKTSVYTLLINILNLSLFFFFFTIISSCKNKKKEISSYNICEEKLPPFNEKFNNVSNAELLRVLCKCIWNKFPVNGWERKVSMKLYKGEDIGWKIKSFSTIFESNLKNCKKTILKNE